MTLRERFQVGSNVLGIVHGMTQFGAFITLDGGYRGLLHVSEMQYTKRVRHPNQVLKKGEAIECTVISIDEEKNRIGLHSVFTKEYKQ